MEEPSNTVYTHKPNSACEKQRVIQLGALHYLD